MLDWRNSIENIIAIGGALSASMLAYKIIKSWVLSPLHDLWDKMQRMMDIGEQLHSILTPNGGSSIADTINKISNDIAWITSRLKLLSSKETDMTFEASAAGEFINANKFFLHFVDRSLEEVIRNGWLNIITEKDRDRVWKAWNKAVEQERDFESDFHIIRDDSVALVHCTATVVRTNKNVLGFLGIIEPSE